MRNVKTVPSDAVCVIGDPDSKGTDGKEVDTGDEEEEEEEPGPDSKFRIFMNWMRGLPAEEYGAEEGEEPRNVFVRLTTNQYFEATTMSVITANAVWIGIDTEMNHDSLKDEDGNAPLGLLATVVENLFCFYFTGEVIIRFFAFNSKRDCCFDAWFVFDSILVACMVLETWVMVVVSAAMNSDSSGGVGPLSALRLLRLLRLARVGRLMRFFPEMKKLVKGIVKAARSVVFILIFLVLVCYVFAIVFTGSLSDRELYPLTPYCSQEEEQGLNESDGCLADNEFGDLGQDYFASMGDGLMSLFTRGVLGDNLAETVEAILACSTMLMWVFCVFMIISFATLLNMLIGVVCEVISDSAAEEEEEESRNHLKESIMLAFSEIDENGDGLVTDVEWKHIADNEQVREVFTTIGIEEERMEERLAQMSAMMFPPDGDDDGDGDMGGVGLMKMLPGQDAPVEEVKGLTVDELVDKVVSIRPDQGASALDLELMKAQVVKDQKMFKSKLKKINRLVGKFIEKQQAEQDKTINKRSKKR